jgi:hypothetical protein
MITAGYPWRKGLDRGAVLEDITKLLVGIKFLSSMQSIMKNIRFNLTVKLPVYTLE